jgi:hypothetical protein
MPRRRRHGGRRNPSRRPAFAKARRGKSAYRTASDVKQPAALSPPSFRDGPQDQTTGVQLHPRESRDSGFDASHRPGMTAKLDHQTATHAKSSRSAKRPRICSKPHPPKIQRAQARPGARRTRGLVRHVAKAMLRPSMQVWRKPPAFPAQWLYGLYVIALVTLLFVTPSLSGSVDCPRT